MASDLISREALVDKSEILYQHTASGKIIPWSAVRVCAINNTPTVDAVEVVRCKDCQERTQSCGMVLHCRLNGIQTDDDDFCSYGRKLVEKDETD